MKILFTSIGRRVELVQAFRKASDKIEDDLVIYGADVRSDAPALSFCDKQVRVPLIHESNYLSQLVDICRYEKIDVLIPTIDTDLLLLAQNKQLFGDTKVMVCECDIVRTCRDKRLTTQFFLDCGLKAPIPVDEVNHYEGGFPCFIKPLDGSSSINAYRVENMDDLRHYAKRMSGYIIQPFIDGTEFTVDIFCDFQGRPILITPRERIAVRSGEVLKTKIVQDPRIIRECKSIIDRWKPVGAITVQLIREMSSGDDYYIEINPRFGGGAPLSMKAGADSAEALLRLLRGDKLQYQEKAARDACIFCRFDQSVCMSGASSPIQAIVFDLDDTLYSEKEYVASGFRAVEREFPSVRFTDLYAKFLSGIQVFDEYGNKEELLKVYREHIPSIHLYDGVLALLRTLRDKGIKLGIITDGRPSGQRNKIVALGLENLVDEIIITDELGIMFRKPNDISYRIMQQKLRVPFENMVYVGDNIAKDFISPTRLSMRSLWFDNTDGLYYMNHQEMVHTTITRIREIGMVQDFV